MINTFVQVCLPVICMCVCTLRLPIIFIDDNQWKPVDYYVYVYVYDGDEKKRREWLLISLRIRSYFSRTASNRLLWLLLKDEKEGEEKGKCFNLYKYYTCMYNEGRLNDKAKIS